MSAYRPGVRGPTPGRFAPTGSGWGAGRTPGVSLYGTRSSHLVKHAEISTDLCIVVLGPSPFTLLLDIQYIISWSGER